MIDGHKYYTQELFSNLAYHKSGVGKGCALSEALAREPEGGRDGHGGHDDWQRLHRRLPDYAARRRQSDFVGRGRRGRHARLRGPGGPRPLQRWAWSTGRGYVASSASHEAVTDADGHATVTYTASKFNVQCWVLATEADGGKGSESIIYQGTDVKVRARRWWPGSRTNCTRAAPPPFP